MIDIAPNNEGIATVPPTVPPTPPPPLPPPPPSLTPSSMATPPMGESAPDQNSIIDSFHRVGNLSEITDFSISTDSSENMTGKYSHNESIHSAVTIEDEQELTGKEDTRMAFYFRILVVALFVTLCALVPSIIYTVAHRNEVHSFESSFAALAEKVMDSVEYQLARKLSAIDSLRIAVTSFAAYTNTTWPFVTIPDYDLRGSGAQDLADTLMVAIHPLVMTDTRRLWQDYAVDNIGWLWQAQSRESMVSRTLQMEEPCWSIQTNTTTNRSHASIERIRRQLITPNYTYSFSSDIFQFDASSPNGVAVEETPGPYLPTWQVMPPLQQIINYDILSDPALRAAAEATMQSKEVTISQLNKLQQMSQQEANLVSALYSNLLELRYGKPNMTYHGDQIATMLYPIFDTFDTKTRRLVGMFSAIIYFEQFFSAILPPNTNGVLGVVENGCGDQFTYEINGDTAVFLGNEDLHDRSFDYMVQTFEFASLGNSKTFSYSEKSVKLNQEHCPYTLYVYPSMDLQNEYITSQPVIYSVSMGLVVLFISCTSLLYDIYVQRRMRRVLKKAKESRAIVSSLFPANVRDRLLQEEEERKQRVSAALDRGCSRRASADSRRTSNESRRNSNERDSRRGSNEPGARRLSNERGEPIRLRMPTRESIMSDMFNLPVTAMAGFAALAPAKLRLKFFLHDTSHHETPNYAMEEHESAEDEDNDLTLHATPIADLFPNCTVLFADISGFTAWSSEREPEQVFTLLQTIFQAFDRLARLKQVFKVETIGDCYVAVTGLPGRYLCST